MVSATGLTLREAEVKERGRPWQLDAPVELAVDAGELGAWISVATVSASRGLEAVFSGGATAKAETEVPAL